LEILEGITDEFGTVEFEVGGSGCSHAVYSACVVKVNGVTVRDYEHAKSPDYDGDSGDGVVNLADLIQFANEFLNASPNECHDYDNTGETTLPDLILFSPPFLHSNHCP